MGSPSPPFRIRLRHASFDAFIDKFAPNVTRGGVFLASRTPRPVGESFGFEIQLAGGEVALAGDCKVIWIKAFDPAAPNKPHGMGVQFLRLDAPSRDLLNKILTRKANNSGPIRIAGANGSAAAHRPGTNGTAAAVAVTPGPRVDTNVDLASEFGVDEAHLRRVVDRHWLGAGRATSEVDELEALLKPEPMVAVSISQALAELPRLLDPARRMSGAFRTLAPATQNTPPPVPPNGDHSVEK